MLITVKKITLNTALLFTSVLLLASNGYSKSVSINNIQAPIVLTEALQEESINLSATAFIHNNIIIAQNTSWHNQHNLDLHSRDSTSIGSLAGINMDNISAVGITAIRPPPPTTTRCRNIGGFVMCGVLGGNEGGDAAGMGR